MMQYENCEPFAYATFRYDYRYTSNSGTLAAATALALGLGATEPVAEQQSKMHWPTRDELREQIAQLTSTLAILERDTHDILPNSET